MAKVAIRVAVGMRAARRDAGPFRHRSKTEQAEIMRRPARSLQVIDTAETWRGQRPEQPIHAQYVPPLRPVVDQNPVEPWRSAHPAGERRGREQRDAGVAMKRADGRESG